MNTRVRILNLGVTLISIILIVTLSYSAITLQSRKGILFEREQELGKVQKEHEDLTRKLAQASTPEFVERAAREKLGLLKEGEQVIIMPKPQAADTTANPPESNLPKWKQWWELFFLSLTSK